MANVTSNDDIIKEFKKFSVIVENHEGRIVNLEQWKIAYDAAVKAISDYKKDNPGEPNSKMNLSSKDFLNIILKLLGIVTAALAITYALVTR